MPREEKSAARPQAGQEVRGLGGARPARRAPTPGRIIDRAQYCKENEVDAINVARRPARLGAHERAVALRAACRSKVGIDTILHYTCRDRNLLGIQSDLLGAYALGLRNILAITGDPPKLGDYPDATAVYDVDSIGLIRIMDHLNHGCDLAGNLIGPALGHPHRLRRRPQQAGHGEGGPAAGGEGAGGRRVHHDPARLRPAAPSSASSASIRHLDVPGAGRHPAPLLAPQRGVPAQRGAGDDASPTTSASACGRRAPARRPRPKA